MFMIEVQKSTEGDTQSPERSSGPLSESRVRACSGFCVSPSVPYLFSFFSTPPSPHSQLFLISSSY